MKDVVGMLDELQNKALKKEELKEKVMKEFSAFQAE